MRLALRLVLTASIFAIILLVVIKGILQDFWDQYNVTSYIGSSLKETFGRHGSVHYMPPLPGVKGDKIIVMARMEEDDTDWVTKDLSEYGSHATYEASQAS